MNPKLHIVIGSTRPGRIGPSVARWFHEFALADSRFQPRLVDIADFELPVYDEPKHPRLKQYEHAHTKAWSAVIDEADAFAFVTPEYNYFAPPALVNALTFLSNEWAYKPAALVSYGGVSGGLRAAQSEKALLTSLRMMPIPEGVTVPGVASHVHDGVFRSNEPIDLSARTLLGELLRWTLALKTMRTA